MESKRLAWAMDMNMVKVSCDCLHLTFSAYVRSKLHSSYITVIIHKNKFVAPDGTHTNNIENVWPNLKMELKRMHGSQGQMLDRHIDGYMYRYNKV